jgi:hypothetical protein
MNCYDGNHASKLKYQWFKEKKNGGCICMVHVEYIGPPSLLLGKMV